MDDDIDYMSDEFLTSIVDSKSDIRPGLIKNRNEIREHNLMKKKTSIATEQKNKKPEVVEAKALENGLKQPISKTNKGFSMLQKMGFKSGMGLGKDNSGIVEPIPIQIKNNKKGLGHQKINLNLSKSSKGGTETKGLNEKDFTSFLSKKSQEKKIVSDLRKSQRLCQELDLKNNKSEPEKVWFWPQDSTEFVETENVDCDKKDEETNDEKKLEILTSYLRKTYFYCIWCVVQYEDEKDMQECPGATRNDH